jgi:DNA-binding protein HU-beta
MKVILYEQVRNINENVRKEIVSVDIGYWALIKLAVTVNKKELVGRIASDACLTRAQASRALDAFVQGIQTSLERGDRVTISGFGTFGVSHRKARRVRNPRSGSAMEVAAKRVPRFAPGVELKSAIDRPASNVG